MRLASMTGRQKLLKSALFLIPARTSYDGRGFVHGPAKDIFERPIGAISFIVSHVTLAFLKGMDISVLSVTGTMAISFLDRGYHREAVA